jgi:hypothetical protein
VKKLGTGPLELGALCSLSSVTGNWIGWELGRRDRETKRGREAIENERRRKKIVFGGFWAANARMRELIYLGQQSDSSLND